MVGIAEKRRESLKRRHRRIRISMSGTAERPRLAVKRTGKHIYAQIIDDESGKSLAMSSSLDPQIKGGLTGKSKVERSQAVGKRIAEIAKEKGIAKVAFDRGGHVYHGRVRALAESAREAGLDF